MAASRIIDRPPSHPHFLAAVFALTVLASICPLVAGTLQQQGLSYGPTAYTASAAFPTSVYSSYYNDPTQTIAQVQPVISDTILNVVYPYELTNPDTIPTVDLDDPEPLPTPASPSQLFASAVRQIRSIVSPSTPNSIFQQSKDDIDSSRKSQCAACQAALSVLKFVALSAPEQGPPLVVELCVAFKMENTREACESKYNIYAYGSTVTQVLAEADVFGYDGQYFCQNFMGACPLPPTSPLNLTSWFAKPKPSPLPPPKQPSGKRLKVLHVSDLHLDPRYSTGAEANCTSGLCCRENNFATSSPNKTIFPAPRFGAYKCDAPYSLFLAALEAINVLTGTESQAFDFALYTGDLVSHDPEKQLSRAYVEYTEFVVYDLIRRMLNIKTVYVALGNHDSHHEAQDAPHSLSGGLGNQYSWNYDHVSRLWETEGWIDHSTVDIARAHYGAYMVRRMDGLRIITLNTDLWLKANMYNYINMTSSDPSGMLRFLTDELQDAEDAGDRVWIMGHVLTGWNGMDPILNPTNLFYQIVDRFSPHIIANIFWGHTHEDEFSIFYANNATNISAGTAQTVAWIGPSLTPLTNLNSGFRVYEVDSNTFEVLDARTWRAEVNTFTDIDMQNVGPTYAFEYDTRTAYGGAVPGWGTSDPLNATWWHRVTEAMSANQTLMDLFTTYQGKSSILTRPCKGDCAAAKICYMRSGSASIAFQKCPSGYGSVQS